MKDSVNGSATSLSRNRAFDAFDDCRSMSCVVVPLSGHTSGMDFVRFSRFHYPDLNCANVARVTRRGVFAAGCVAGLEEVG